MLIPYTAPPIMLDSDEIKNPIKQSEEPSDVRKFSDAINFPLEGRIPPKHTVHKLDPKHLHSSQSTVSRSHMRLMAKGESENDDYIDVAKSSTGSHHILDGNHRAAHALKHGSQVEARVYDMKDHKNVLPIHYS